MITAMIFPTATMSARFSSWSKKNAGFRKAFEYVATNRVLITYELPLGEIVLDFYDRLKSVSRGYASLDYHILGLQGIPAWSSSISWWPANPSTPSR